MNATPVLAFVWSDESHAADLEAFFLESRRARRRKPRIEAFVASRGPAAGRSKAGAMKA